jgi:polyhydroxyalkanoate synthesis repressor PhaR
MTETAAAAAAPITIKKYANRRLYNTATSSYVTLEHLCQMVKDGSDFVVFDAKTGEDITRSVLTQIIVEEEGKGQNLLPISFLRRLISFYGDSLGGIVPRYLEHSMQAFGHNEDQMRELMKTTFGGMFPFGQVTDLAAQNRLFFENAMKLFGPFLGDTVTRAAAPPPAPASDPGIADLKAKLNEMQAQLNSLTSKSK